MPPPEDIKIPSSSPTLKHYHAYRPASSYNYCESSRRSSASVNAAVSNLLHSEHPPSTRSVASPLSVSPGFAVPRQFPKIGFSSRRSVDSKYSNYDESQSGTNPIPTPVSETAPTSLDDSLDFLLRTQPPNKHRAIASRLAMFKPINVAPSSIKDTKDVRDDESELSELGSHPSFSPNFGTFGHRHASEEPSLDKQSTDVGEALITGAHSPHSERAIKRIILRPSSGQSSSGTESLAQEGRTRTPLPTSPQPPANLEKGVILGYWRDSNAENIDDKHAVIGFIDARDRLRTRIHHTNKTGKTVTDTYPLPPGPGASWVTFDRIVFSDHLVGLDHDEVKEYARILSGMSFASVAAAREREQAAVSEASKRAREKAQAEGSTAQPLIAYGLEVPRGLGYEWQRQQKGDAKDSEGDNISESTPFVQLEPLPGTRPTSVVIGYWRGSDIAEPKDKHAALGIISQTDGFRVKVVRETRDGRPAEGNFPTNLGGIWLNYDQVVLEPHLQQLTRLEVKEYVRVRQFQIDQDERPSQETTNIALAVEDARSRVATSRGIIRPTNESSPVKRAAAVPSNNVTEPIIAELSRPLRRIESKPPHRDSLKGKKRTSAIAGLIERTASHARRHIARAEGREDRADLKEQHQERLLHAEAMTTAPNSPPTNSVNGLRAPVHQREDIQRLNAVWARQEARRMRYDDQDRIVHGGIKYERRPSGPFADKFASHGSIINIDGEDYVEYRVLTKVNI